MSDKVVFRNSLQVASDVSVYDMNGFFAELSEKGYVFQQFTGHFDRDEKEIYEGDILRLTSPNHQNKYLGVVEMGIGEDSDGWRCQLWNGWVIKPIEERYTDFYSLEDYSGKKMREDYGGYCEKIGNIYENPELLQG